MMEAGRAMHTPLCPAGHFPLKGGDRQLRRPVLYDNVAEDAPREPCMISPLEGVAVAVAEGDGKPKVWLSKLQGPGRAERGGTSASAGPRFTHTHNFGAEREG